MAVWCACVKRSTAAALPAKWLTSFGFLTFIINFFPWTNFYDITCLQAVLVVQKEPLFIDHNIMLPARLVHKCWRACTYATL